MDQPESFVRYQKALSEFFNDINSDIVELRKSIISLMLQNPVSHAAAEQVIFNHIENKLKRLDDASVKTAVKTFLTKLKDISPVNADWISPDLGYMWDLELWDYGEILYNDIENVIQQIKIPIGEIEADTLRIAIPESVTTRHELIYVPKLIEIWEETGGDIQEHFAGSQALDANAPYSATAPAGYIDSIEKRLIVHNDFKDYIANGIKQYVNGTMSFSLSTEVDLHHTNYALGSTMETAQYYQEWLRGQPMDVKQKAFNIFGFPIEPYKGMTDANKSIDVEDVNRFVNNQDIINETFTGELQAKLGIFIDSELNIDTPYMQQNSGRTMLLPDEFMRQFLSYSKEEFGTDEAFDNINADNLLFDTSKYTTNDFNTYINKKYANMLDTFALVENGLGSAILEELYVRNPGNGLGSQIMQELVDWADTNNIELQLDTRNFDSGLSSDARNKEKLRDFYRGFGFELSPLGDDGLTYDSPETGRQREMVRKSPSRSLKFRNESPLNFDNPQRQDFIKLDSYTDVDIVVRDPGGLHARPSALLVKTLEGTGALVTNSKGVIVPMNNISLLTLGKQQGDTFTIKLPLETPDIEDLINKVDGLEYTPKPTTTITTAEQLNIDPDALSKVEDFSNKFPETAKAIYNSSKAAVGKVLNAAQIFDPGDIVIVQSIQKLLPRLGAAAIAAPALIGYIFYELTVLAADVTTALGTASRKQDIGQQAPALSFTGGKTLDGEDVNYQPTDWKQFGSDTWEEFGEVSDTYSISWKLSEPMINWAFDKVSNYNGDQ